jgi:aminoglycoside phosphotransferase (APT) family kinase protein
MTPDLDIEQPAALLAYLRESGRVAPDESPRVEILAGGVSNRTVLVSRPTGESWVLKQALEKLRVAVDWFSDPRRIEREALGLKHLAEIAPPGAITPLVFEDPANHLLAMQAVPQPHANWKSLLMAGRINPAHVAQFARLLATIHRRGYERRIELGQLFADRSFFESLRIEPYYRYTARQVPETYPFFKQLIFDTNVRQLTIVHGDYSPKNVLIHNGRLVLLDHEVIHFGDPAFDVGFALTHLLSKAHHLKSHRRAFGEAADLFWRTYQDSLPEADWRKNLCDRVVDHALGCLLARVAGRSPLEYLTPDERAAQRAAVLHLINTRPAGVRGLVTDFIDRLPT